MAAVKKSSLYYCAFESIFDPVFLSQTVVFIAKANEKLKPENDYFNLAVFHSFKDIFKKSYHRQKQSIRDKLEGRCFFSVKFPYLYRIPFLFNTAIFINFLICSVTFASVFNFKKKTRAIIQARSDIGSYIAIKMKNNFFKNIKIISDCRGIGSLEVLYLKSLRKKKEVSVKIAEIENHVYKNSDHIFCVSGNFKDYITSRQGIIKESGGHVPDISVLPCCIDTEIFKFDPCIRSAVREELACSDRFALIYSGSMNEWQLPLEMIRIFKMISAMIKNSIFLIFTRDDEYTMELMSGSGISRNDYLVKKLSFEEVNRYLMAGDLGLLIRDENDMNRVAFPVKFSEYIRCGVPVLTTMTSEIAKVIDKYSLGFSLSDYNNDDEVMATASIIREKLSYISSNDYKMEISSNIAGIYGWDSCLKGIMNVYRKLKNGI